MKAITGFTLIYILLALQEAEAQHRATPDDDLGISWMHVQAVTPSGGRVVLQGRRQDGSCWELVICYDHHLKAEHDYLSGICPDGAGYRYPGTMRITAHPIQPVFPLSPHLACVRIRAPTVS